LSAFGARRIFMRLVSAVCDSGFPAA